MCAKEFPIGTAFSRHKWQKLADAGVFTLRLEDGAGLGMTEAVIVFEELGRALVPGPLVATHIFAGVVDGDVVAIADNGLVLHGREADAVVFSEGDDVFVTSPITGDDIDPLDPLTPIVRVGPLIGSPISAQARDVQGLGACLTAALSSGVASRTVEVAVAYAKERVQFDKPIGSFQAVKHMCADMFVRAEVARAAVDAAGVLIDQHDADVERAVTSAKLLASEAAIANAKTNIQVHGGMGFTWEVDAHLFLKRAVVYATQFGGLDAQAERMAGLL